jgi:hypothetical protein
VELDDRGLERDVEVARCLLGAKDDQVGHSQQQDDRGGDVRSDSPAPWQPGRPKPSIGEQHAAYGKASERERGEVEGGGAGESKQHSEHQRACACPGEWRESSRPQQQRRAGAPCGAREEGRGHRHPCRGGAKDDDDPAAPEKLGDPHEQERRHERRRQPTGEGGKRSAVRPAGDPVGQARPQDQRERQDHEERGEEERGLRVLPLLAELATRWDWHRFDDEHHDCQHECEAGAGEGHGQRQRRAPVGARFGSAVGGDQAAASISGAGMWIPPGRGRTIYVDAGCH